MRIRFDDCAIDLRVGVAEDHAEWKDFQKLDCCNSFENGLNKFGRWLGKENNDWKGLGSGR
jgi:hypothetical protein